MNMFSRVIAIFLVLSFVGLPQIGHAEKRQTRIQRQIETQANRQEQLEQNNKTRMQKQKSDNQRKRDNAVRQQEQKKRQNEQRLRSQKQDNKSKRNQEKQRAKRRYDNDTGSFRFND